jgi:hypothetical protein
MTMLTLISALVPLFSPPSGWQAVQPKESSVKVGFVGESRTLYRPSIHLASEKVNCDLKAYLKAVKEIHLTRPDTVWRDLGTLEMKAGTGRLTESRTPSTSVLQAIYLKDGVAYILTAAVAREDFLPRQKEIIDSFKSFELFSDLWSPIQDEKLRNRILSNIEAKEWKKVRQLIEKETSSMGEFWQLLALQEAYEKIYPQ